MSNSIVEKWDEIKTLVESIELDVHKNSGGNSSAGVRARRGLRALKSESSNLVRLMIETDKERKATK
tara:strand:+ start:2055 stop:2255 length:201 start_codon:yes stop_codon:yes gene_type:complete